MATLGARPGRHRHDDIRLSGAFPPASLAAHCAASSTDFRYRSDRPCPAWRRRRGFTAARTVFSISPRTASGRSAGRGCTSRRAASPPSGAAARPSPAAVSRRPGADAAVAGHARDRRVQPRLQRRALVRSASSSARSRSSGAGSGAPSAAGMARTSTAPAPKASSSRPSRASSAARASSRAASAGGRSTTAGSSSGCARTPPPASARAAPRGSGARARRAGRPAPASHPRRRR